MKILLDTMAFLWWVTDGPSLSHRVKKAIGDPNNSVFFSAASAWEIVIKTKLGKLRLKRTPAAFIRTHLQRNDVTSLPIELSHALQLYKLPNIHKDPFDRILVAQSQVEQLYIATNDTEIEKYDVDLLW